MYRPTARARTALAVVAITGLAASALTLGASACTTAYGPAGANDDAGGDATMTTAVPDGAAPREDGDADAAAPDARECPDSSVLPQALYVLGGQVDETSTASPLDVLRATACADGTLGAWTVEKDLALPHELDWPSAGLVGETLIVVGGLSSVVGAPSPIIYASKRQTDGTFGPLMANGALAPGTASQRALFASDGQRLVVTGGFTGAAGASLGLTDQAVAIQVTAGLVKTSSLSPLPQPRSDGVLLLTPMHALVVGSGVAGPSAVGSVIEETVLTDAGDFGPWTTADSYSDQANAALVIGGFLYIVGGTLSPSTMVIETFVPPAGLTGATRINLPNASPHAATIGGFLYLVDGTTMPGAVFTGKQGMTGTFSFAAAPSLPAHRGGFVVLAL